MSISRRRPNFFPLRTDSKKGCRRISKITGLAFGSHNFSISREITQRVATIKLNDERGSLNARQEFMKLQIIPQGHITLELCYATVVKNRPR